MKDRVFVRLYFGIAVAGVIFYLIPYFIVPVMWVAVQLFAIVLVGVVYVLGYVVLDVLMDTGEVGR